MSKKEEDILKICFEKLKYFNYSNQTIECYMFYIKKFIFKTNKYYQHLTSHDFQKYLDNYQFTSISQQNQIINAIKFFYEKVLNRKYNKIDFQRPKSEKKLPKVIDNDFLIKKISLIDNLKHRAILSIGYSVGLRVSEVINLKIKNIDSKRMIINIKNGKGKKDRVVPLSHKILELLRNYYRNYKPKIYLFNGQSSLQYSSASCNKLVKKYIGKEYHFHLLRHSSFTSMLESGTDLRVIQKIAGHKNSKTTEIYTHVSKQLLNKVVTPL